MLAALALKNSGAISGEILKHWRSQTGCQKQEQNL